jgi:adenylate cyclase
LAQENQAVVAVARIIVTWLRGSPVARGPALDKRSGNAERQQSGPVPAPAHVRRQLERILASPQLAHAPALGALLRYVVERTLQGEADRLKEYTLGVEVFDRGAEFDPRVDTIVRAQSRRLRAKLDEYYRGPGRGDPVRIGLPKGHYVPVFAPQAYGDVAPAGTEAIVASVAVLERRPAGPDQSAPDPGTRPWLLATLALALFVLVALNWWPSPADAPGAEGQSAAPHTIAVLPFVDMSPGRDLEYLADGLAEELIHILAQSPSLQVTARTSAFAFKGGQSDIPTITDALGVQYVIEGSLRQHDDRMRVTVQLIDTANNAHVWSNVYDSTRAQAFEVQTEIAEAVAASLRVVLAGDRGGHHVPDPQAHAQFLQARLLINRRGPGELERAGELLQSAVDLDPGYARAWAALGSVLYLRTMGGELQPWESGMQSMLVAIDRALALDPHLAEAHIRRGHYLAWVHGDRDGAVEHMRFALAREPDNPLGLAVVAGWLGDRGQFDEALALQRQALDIDPLNLVQRNNLALFLIAAGDLPAAEVEIDRLLALDPQSMPARILRAGLLNLQGRSYESLQVLQALADSPERGYHMALAHARLGRAAEAEAALAALEARSTFRNRLHPRVARAEMLVLLGEHEQAERLLFSTSRPDTRTPAGKSEHYALGSALHSPYLHPLREGPGWGNWSRTFFGERVPLELDTLLPAQAQRASTIRDAQLRTSSR